MVVLLLAAVVAAAVVAASVLAMAMANPMLPHATVVSKGQNNGVTNPTPYNSAPDPDQISGLNGPLTVQETGQGYLRVTRPVKLVDLTASTAAGGTLTNLHALSIFVGNIGNRAVTIYSNSVQPGSAQRHVPNVTIPAGVDIYFQAYQLAAAAAEENVWNLSFA